MISEIFSKVGDVNDAYERLEQAMDASQIASNARVIMINPLHYNYPQIAVHIQVIIIINIGCWVNVSVSRMRDYILVSSSLLLNNRVHFYDCFLES